MQRSKPRLLSKQMIHTLEIGKIQRIGNVMLVLEARRLKRPATNYNLWVYQSSTAEEDTAMHAWFGQNFQATENYPA